MEFLGTYSNRGGALEKLRSVLARCPSESPKKDRGVRQRQTRLGTADQAKLVQAYRDGVTLIELAARFSVHRQTVSEILKRHGIDRRYRRIEPHQLAQIRAWYHDAGESLATIGRRLGVDAGTVHKAMRDAGIPTRPRVGR